MIGGGGVLDTNVGATPLWSLVFDGNAHFLNLVSGQTLVLWVKTVRSSSVASQGWKTGWAKRRKLLLTRPLRIRENTHFVNAFGKAMAFLRGNFPLSTSYVSFCS